MDRIHIMLDSFIEDVNNEDGNTARFFDKITALLFSLIKWIGVPFVIYLVFELTRL
jgi:hypothetical protein